MRKGADNESAYQRDDVLKSRGKKPDDQAQHQQAFETSSSIMISSNQKKVALNCHEAVMIEMFEDRICAERLSEHDLESLAAAAGPCQDLSKVVNGKQYQLSSFALCDSKGYTTTTYFGSATCQQGTRSVVSRGQWAKCRRSATELYDEKAYYANHTSQSANALKLASFAILAFFASQF